jgi:murein DD-endopeptidase MepM/ murein hydrolase activator NlpD
VVFYSQDFGIFGKTIILEHPEGISSVYARNSEVYVKVGDTVAKGAVLARVGSGGKDSRKYLHFEIRKGHIAKNPLFYLP